MLKLARTYPLATGALVVAALVLFWVYLNTPKKRSLRDVLETARTVVVYQGDPEIGGGEKVGDWNRDRNPEIFSWLKRCEHSPSSPPQARPNYTFVVLDFHMGKPHHTYGYISALGLLGAEEEWCVVPDELKAWMQSQANRKPREPVSVPDKEGPGTAVVTPERPPQPNR